MRKSLLLLFLMASFMGCYAQQSAETWVDSVFRTLSPDEKIAQLMVIRLSAIDPSPRRAVFYDKEVEEAVKKYNVGGICLFQGDPLTPTGYINYFQRLARTPILFCIEAEDGVGMRMGSVMGLPRQMIVGTTADPSLADQIC